MAERKLGARNVMRGDYRIIEARSIYNPAPETATWRVYFKQALDPISEHQTRTQAQAAVDRYLQADAQRKR